MGWFGRKKFGTRRGGRNRTRAGAVVSDRDATTADREHLAGFIDGHQGVEGFVEPQTTVSQTTLLLVAKDGEWTRRRVPSARWAHDFTNKLGVPTYDASVVGYPQRMRDYNHRQAQAAKRQSEA
jgi:hypothetical protein